MTRILLFNIPTAEVPTEYPPVAISRVMEGLDPSLRCDVSFFNLDYYRPGFDEIRNRIETFKPDIIGISAILTPTYAYVKKLSNYIKECFPHIIQIQGGEIAVMANIILAKTGIDFCVMGESEPTFSNLIRRLQQEDLRLTKMENFVEIKGLLFRLNGTAHFTGYEKDSDGNGLRQFNYKLVSQFTDINHYIHPMPGQYFRSRISGDEKMEYFLDQLHPHNRNKKIATAFTSKGCVVKCTFCHRFLKGYMVNETAGIIDYIENLRKDHDVGMVLFSEENFGSDREATSKLVEYLRDAGLNWAPTATRAKTVTEETARTWREAGCVHINSGLETASQKMLDVMEKKTSVEENLNYLRRCAKNKIFTVIGTVIGMPGETHETIDESIDNFATALSDDVRMPFELYSNFVQAIPGTPVYEYARREGLIGMSLEDEEKYMESLYDMNADELDHYLNFTDYQKEEVAYWQSYFVLEMLAAHIKQHGYVKILKHNKSNKSKKFRAALVYSLFPRPVRRFLLKYLVILLSWGPVRLVKVVSVMLFRKRTGKFATVNTSVRRVNREIPLVIREDDRSTAILREGR